MSLDNKNSYFEINICGRRLKKDVEIISQCEDIIEPILSRLNSEESYVAYNYKGNDYNVSVWFKTKTRKRLSTLRNAIIKSRLIIDNSTELQQRGKDEDLSKLLSKMATQPTFVDCNSLRKADYNNRISSQLAASKQSDRYMLFSDIEDPELYTGTDIDILKDKNNWYGWQKKLYEMIFDKRGRIKNAVEREIIFIEDPYGNSGKSTFWKWLYLTNRNEIGILSEATSSQIKANIVGLGDKRLYIIDLPRTESKEGTTGLLNALEALKNGMINTSMYGSTEVLCITPPWIVITGNSMPSGSWTPDRWKVFKIKNNSKKEWVDVSPQRRKLAKEEIILDNKIKKLSKVKKIEQLNRLKKSELALSNM